MNMAEAAQHPVMKYLLEGEVLKKKEEIRKATLGYFNQNEIHSLMNIKVSVFTTGCRKIDGFIEPMNDNLLLIVTNGCNELVALNNIASITLSENDVQEVKRKMGFDPHR